MGFFNKFFKKKLNTEPDDEAPISRSSLDLSDAYLREQYVISCLEQLKEAEGEIDQINSEYASVTAQLTDMEEIEGLKGEKRDELCAIAKNIHDYRLAHDKFVLNPGNMTESEFDRLEALGDETPDGIKKISKEEEYKAKVKSDLNRIDREKTAYTFRRAEVSRNLENMRGISMIAIVAAAVLMVILLLLQLLLSLDVSIGYYIGVIAVALTETIVYLKYTDYSREKRKIESTVNELILLENKVKIRYVNNKNLLDYLYTKYGVESSKELKELYEKFLKEREDRRAFEKNEALYAEEIARLSKRLKTLNILNPEIWLHQSDAIYDKREMVEIRHRLIGRRQKLRKQLEYNEQVALEASNEIRQVANNYPESSNSIMEMIDKYSLEK